jgi:hypothetical protein
VPAGRIIAKFVSPKWIVVFAFSVKGQPYSESSYAARKSRTT